MPCRVFALSAVSTGERSGGGFFRKRLKDRMKEAEETQRRENEENKKRLDWQRQHRHETQPDNV